MSKRWLSVQQIDLKRWCFPLFPDCSIERERFWFNFHLVLKMMSNSTNLTLNFLNKFSPSIVKYAPTEVLSFGALDYKLSLLTGLIICTLSLISLTGNFLMMILYVKHKTLRTSSNKLVVNLTCSNTLMHIKSWIVIVNGIAGGPILGPFGKKNKFFLNVGGLS